MFHNTFKLLAPSLTIFVIVSCSEDEHISPTIDVLIDSYDSSVVADSSAQDLTSDDLNSTDVQVHDMLDVTSPDVDSGVEDSGDVPEVPGARARVIVDESDLIGGRQATGRIGDILIVNDHVRFIIRTAERGLYSPSGGNLVDADIVRTPGEAGNDRFLESFAMVGFGRGVRADQIEIADDGKATGRAVVRVHGTDLGLTLIDSVLPTYPLDLDVTLEYALDADSRHLVITTTVKNTGKFTMDVPVGQFLQFGNSLEKFSHRCGPDLDCVANRTDIDWMAAAGGDVSYGIASPATFKPTVVLAREEVLLLQTELLKIPAGNEDSVVQFFFVGNGTIADIAEQAWTAREADSRIEFGVDIDAADPTILADVRVVANSQDDGKPICSTRPDDDGKARMMLPIGSYDMIISAPGLPTQTIENVDVSTLSGALPATIVTPGRVEITVKDANDQPVHAVAVLQGGHGAAWGAGTGQTILVPGGTATAIVAEGDYTITVSRGYEYSIDRQDISVTKGQVTTVSATLNREVDTTGWIAMDSHDHCELSIDSDVLVEKRVANAMGTGVEVVSTTDHDHFGTLQPTVEALGFANDILALDGNEISPLWGHTVVIGCDAGYDYDTYFAVPFNYYTDEGMVDRSLTASEIYDTARDVHQCNLIIVAHPWDGQATFEYYGLEPGVDPASLAPDLDLTKVDGCEVINSHDPEDEIFVQNVPSWLDIIAHGYKVTGTGSSDEHGIGVAFGHPRNMVMSSTDVPGEVEPAEIYANIKAMKTQVMGGPFIELTINDEGLGSTVVDGDGMVSVAVRVQAPSWMQIDWVKIYVNGVEMDLEGLVTDGILRMNTTLDVEILADAFIVASAGSDTWRMGPASRNWPPMSVTNPVFIDVDGDGWKAPLAD